MDIIDTTLRICSPTYSREKLQPKNGIDEEQVMWSLLILKTRVMFYSGYKFAGAESDARLLW